MSVHTLTPGGLRGLEQSQESSSCPRADPSLTAEGSCLLISWSLPSTSPLEPTPKRKSSRTEWKYWGQSSGFRLSTKWPQVTGGLTRPLVLIILPITKEKLGFAVF